MHRDLREKLFKLFGTIRPCVNESG
ncbi:protein of unknown function (plasmid) [Cupriavidus taiwanensis]|uniref:Uncharacterized protein n=1 Tax=Cupriavidus taiwanensis TaxID=164546 RepID=A0A7Z7NNI4_9BURK|nr:protein of unknown function [Cupriavidus taiwanensis]SOZ11655.1 protein of unknown function [Cupriavidus taiwanensis]SOZ43009.1 protein of unknown function [Cupriavidus taiwanensis]SPC22256.1 protein of unknown function [Cupriavidus taiwanensis]SPD53758.1 protein of unknown function [Cupriavidus taiwanensis]